jgi:Glycine/D-amino acid oxidases (deaminating)
MQRRAFIETTIKAGTLAGMPLSTLRSTIQKKIHSTHSKSKTYDVIVLGMGSMGSSACYHLAKRGYNVLGIEQMDIPHEHGSHTGQSRIIRKAYFEHPDYVPLLNRAYKNWSSLEEESGTQLYYKTGLLYFGRSDHLLIEGVLKSSSLYDIDLHKIDKRELIDDYPQFNIPGDYHAYIEPDAGLVTPERSILTNVQMALHHGAHINTNEKVLSWNKEGGSIEVRTNKGVYSCKKLVITTGSWLNKVVPDVLPEMKVTRQIMAWVIPKSWDKFTLGNFPCWTIADHEHQGIFYGFPILDAGNFGAPIGLKLAHHSHGPEQNPDNVDRHLDSKEEEKLISFMNRFLPEGYQSTFVQKSCLYTNTSDEHFIVDVLPSNDNVVIAGGFSGHGFKFASVIGEALADLAIDGKSDLPIDFLGLRRFDK